jgi:hypothetical protein
MLLLLLTGRQKDVLQEPFLFGGTIDLEQCKIFIKVLGYRSCTKNYLLGLLIKEACTKQCRPFSADDQ